MSDMTMAEAERAIVVRLTAAMREADEQFERVGGSTRHHVRDCLLPVLEKHGLSVATIEQRDDASRELAAARGELRQRREQVDALLQRQDEITVALGGCAIFPSELPEAARKLRALVEELEKTDSEEWRRRFVEADYARCQAEVKQDSLRARCARLDEAIKHVLNAANPPRNMSGEEVCEFLSGLMRSALGGEWE